MMPNLSVTDDYCGNVSDGSDNLFYDTVKRLTTYYVPVIICVGLVGNLLSIVVLFATNLRCLSSSFYLASLAASDSFFLLALAFTWLTVVDVHWMNYEGVCRLVSYVNAVTSFLSPWLVVAFTVERYIAVCHPLKRAVMCTVGRAKLVITALAVSASVYHLWALVLFDVGVWCGEVQCGPSQAPVMSVLNHIDTVMTMVMPFVVILVTNVTIARKIYNLHMPHTPQAPESSELYPAPPATTDVPENGRWSPRGGGRAVPGGGRKERLRVRSASTSVRTKNQMNITKMLLMVSSVFILLNLPAHSLRMSAYIQWTATSNNFLFLFNLLFYTNFGINFFLYMLCGANFRRALKEMVHRRSLRPGSSTQMTNS